MAVITGTPRPDTLIGTGAADSIYGYGGADLLLGHGGDDLIDGGEGEDRIDGGDGNDKLYGGNSQDSIIAGAGDDLVDGGNGDDTITGAEGADTIDGGLGQDRIDAGDGADSVIGGAGDDTITGAGGADTIDGGLGQDRIDAGEGADSLFGGAGDDTITGAGGNDSVYGGEGNNRLFGGTGHDSLVAGKGDDHLEGDAGNDTFMGGAGNDQMLGGADRDLFIVEGGDDQIYGGSSGTDFDVIDMSPVERWEITSWRPDSDGNGFDGQISIFDSRGNIVNRVQFQNIEQVICFTPGSRIATPRGEVPVEDLRAGDRVITRDDGLQAIRWIGRRTLGGRDLAAAPHLRPILIRKGSLGHDLPERDMMVSPNHRMLVANERTTLYFAEHEVLVAAKHLVDHRNILQTAPPEGTTYIHLLFDRHQVVLADGAWSESFQPGDYSLSGLGSDQRLELFELFPELQTSSGTGAYAAARRTLKRHEAALLAR